MISKLKSRPWVWMGVRVLLSALVVGMLLHYVPLGQLWAALGQLPTALWFAVLAAYLLAQTVGMLKWRMMVNLAGADLSYVQAARCYFGGMFSTLFLPSAVGGDVVRMSLAMREARSVTGAALASLLDRLIDFAALALLAGAGVILLDGAISPTSKHVLWSVAGVTLLAAIAGLAAIAFLPARRFPLRVRRLIVQLRQSWKAVLAQPRYVALALMLGVAVQGSFVLCKICGGFLRAARANAGVAVSVASGEAFGTGAVDAGWDWSSRGSARSAAHAIRSAAGTDGGGGICVGNNYCWGARWLPGCYRLYSDACGLLMSRLAVRDCAGR